MVRISLNKDFKKNDYGEAIFYKDSGEILAAVYPKMGRMVVWNASVPFIFKPPAMSYVQAQYDIVVRLSTSKEKAEQKIRETKVLVFVITNLICIVKNSLYKEGLLSGPIYSDCTPRRFLKPFLPVRLS